ncbi:hypothetical protein DOTSEDRAFT_139968 [Dothistroma septosporum NZE10]|uniref:Pre-mRNA-splicing factor 38B n=1 Tax=Dothistroma septosporum (strain NZE10 / CBS 128990) TaxID=675120 RepID=M2XGJ5_DOTSN|nr:hypothetical protein DOTSEDRAFT_139968 [Dothistroma septosporum NZE10]
MSSDITDDYVAQILKREAERKDSNRFVANGLGSLLSNTRPRNRDAPKPNTRFLKHLVKDVDSHNAALLKKEAEESRARARARKLKDERNGGDERSRSPRKERRRKDERREREVYSARRVHERRSRGHDGTRKGERKVSRERDSKRVDDRKRLRREHDSSGKLDRQPDHERVVAADLDPLEDAIGPKPSMRSAARGRGAHRDSNIDARFDSKYDPAIDVALDDHEDDDDDWEMALETMRDRAKWRKSGAERLRAAGFTEEEVDKWEKGGTRGSNEEGDVESVKWNKKGEGREWDRGKVVEGGHVEVRSEWGRLKDT